MDDYALEVRKKTSCNNSGPPGPGKNLPDLIICTEKSSPRQPQDIFHMSPTAKEGKTPSRVCRGRMTVAPVGTSEAKVGLGRRCSRVGDPLPLASAAPAGSLPSTGRTSPACTALTAVRGCSPSQHLNALQAEQTLAVQLIWLRKGFA